MMDDWVTIDGKFSLFDKAGDTIMIFDNYLQVYYSRRFAKYDYGKKKNILK